MKFIRQSLMWITYNTSVFNMFLAISLTISRAYALVFPPWYFATISVFSVLASFADKYARRLKDQESIDRYIERLLKMFLSDLGPERVNTLQIRLNVLIYERSHLVSKYRVNMHEEGDADIKWLPNQGCIGFCFVSKQIGRASCRVRV